MSETHVTVVGNVATEVTYGETSGGVPMASFRVGCTERRYDRQRECWVDGETQFVAVTAWRALAVNLISSLNKGDPVLVSGRLRVREWKEGEVKRSRAEIDARSVGHDLTRGTSAFRWASAVRGQPAGGVGPGGAEAAGEAGGEPGGEVVPGWIVSALEARRALAAAATAPAAAVRPVMEGQSEVAGSGRGGDVQGVVN
ncbi:single-strand DNA-binding protein [Streptomyces sp. 1114.5]|uniref:single-stranded DNA-binding protein n=1 Tax=unclassified Streptomyces TaxID=2593676 RepID=UPI000BD909F6|nr:MULTISPECIES: single-stranded DNA-binding protein [unclassified Streptomyces]RKT10933.1 single-strand DNA-binding protein [Streptomyces sp. 1114.5]SOB81731.1 single-strand DNA-binding protein [Streptomyces sp. 1331.2]